MKRLFYVFFIIGYLVIQPIHASVVDVLTNLQLRIEQSHTDSLSIFRNGKQVFNYSACKESTRIECGEIKRPILALAIGFLVDERFITSLDTPVATFCPSWEKGPNSHVNIRMLLSNEGNCFYYLEEVIKAISGEEWHEYIQHKLFDPLGINRDCWVLSKKDRMHLFLTAAELSKIGLLILRHGELNGKQLISRLWIDRLMTPVDHVNPFLSMQWALEYFDFSTYWDSSLLHQYGCNGISSSVINNLKELNGRVVHLGGLAIRGKLIHAWGRDIICSLGGQQGLSTLISQTYRHHLPFGYFNGGGVKSLVAWGKGGQQLIIMPGHQLVGVRQSTHLTHRDTMEDFIEILDDYGIECDCYID